MRLPPTTRLASWLVPAGGVLGAAVSFWGIYWACRWFLPGIGGWPAGARIYFVAYLGNELVGLLLCLAGLLVARRAADRVGVRMLAGFMVAQGLVVGYMHGLRTLAGWDLQVALAVVLTEGLAYATAVRTSQLFPRPLHRQAVVEGLSDTRGLWPFAGFLSFLLRPYRVWILALGLAAPPVLLDDPVIGKLAVTVVIATVLLTMTASYRAGGPAIRRQIYWLFLAAEIFLAATLLRLASYISNVWLGLGPRVLTGPEGVFESLPTFVLLDQTIWMLANAGLLGCLVATTFFQGAIDARLVVRRTAVYSVLSSLLLFSFALLENVLSDLLAEALALSRDLVTAGLGAVVALGLRPLDSLLSRVAERWLPRIEPGMDATCHPEAGGIARTGHHPRA